jgi:hypothetical protein
VPTTAPGPRRRRCVLFARHLVESAQFRDATLLLGVRLNWYRSVPLSCVERLEIALDGVPLDPEHTTLELDGVRSPVRELNALDERWWHVLDTATVRIALEARPADGPHAVDLVIGTRIPYLVSPSGDAAVIVDRARAEVTQ